MAEQHLSQEFSINTLLCAICVQAQKINNTKRAEIHILLGHHRSVQTCRQSTLNGMSWWCPCIFWASLPLCQREISNKPLSPMQTQACNCSIAF